MPVGQRPIFRKEAAEAQFRMVFSSSRRSGRAVRGLEHYSQCCSRWHGKGSVAVSLQGLTSADALIERNTIDALTRQQLMDFQLASIQWCLSNKDHIPPSERFRVHLSLSLTFCAIVTNSDVSPFPVDIIVQPPAKLRRPASGSLAKKSSTTPNETAGWTQGLRRLIGDEGA